jgi:hypothetical protein
VSASVESQLTAAAVLQPNNIDWDDDKYACRILEVKLLGRRPRGRSNRRWEVRIKADLRETVFEYER